MKSKSEEEIEQGGRREKSVVDARMRRVGVDGEKRRMESRDQRPGRGAGMVLLDIGSVGCGILDEGERSEQQPASMEWTLCASEEERRRQAV